MTELVSYAASDESRLPVDVNALSSKPGAAWTPDEFDRYMEYLYTDRYNKLITIGQSTLGSLEEGEDALTAFVTEKVASVVHRFNPAKHATIDTWISLKFNFFCRDIARARYKKQAQFTRATQIDIEIIDDSRSLDRAAASEARDLLQSILRELSTADQQLFTARFLEERSLKEIAGQLNIPEGTVKSRLYSLRTKASVIAGKLALPREVWAQ